MLFLSSVRINPLRRGAQKLLGNPHAMHAAVESVLPPGDRRLLWRLEAPTVPSGNRPVEVELLIQSPDRPTLDVIVEQAGWPDAAAGLPRVADMSPLLQVIAKGRQFSFRTRLNPTSSVQQPQHPTANQLSRAPGSQRSVRVGHRTVGHQLDWFLKRAAGDADQWGFSVGPRTEPRVTIEAREHLRFRGRNSNRVSLDTATFAGTLTVTDPDTLREVLAAGIGRGKAFGCGLLTLAPVWE